MIGRLDDMAGNSLNRRRLSGGLARTTFRRLADQAVAEGRWTEPFADLSHEAHEGLGELRRLALMGECRVEKGLQRRARVTFPQRKAAPEERAQVLRGVGEVRNDQQRGVRRSNASIALRSSPAS